MRRKEEVRYVLSPRDHWNTNQAFNTLAHAGTTKLPTKNVPGGTFGLGRFKTSYFPMIVPFYLNDPDFYPEDGE